VDKLSELFEATFCALKEREVESKQQPKAPDSKQNQGNPNQKTPSSSDKPPGTSITATIKIKIPFRLQSLGIRIYNSLLRQFGVAMHKLSDYTGMIFVDVTLVGPFPKKFVGNMWRCLCAESNDKQKELAALGRLLLQRAPSE